MNEIRVALVGGEVGLGFLDFVDCLLIDSTAETNGIEETNRWTPPYEEEDDLGEGLLLARVASH